MKDNKDFDESKLDAEEIKFRSSDNRFLTWLDNFWFYHKWKIAIVLFFGIVFGVGIGQMVGREEQDALVVVGSPMYFYSEYIEGIDSTLTSVLPSAGKDGKKNLVLVTYSIYSEEEMKEANEAETDEDGRYITQVVQSYNTSKHEEYLDHLQTGECSILFISEYLYDALRNQDRLKSVSEIMGDGVTVSGALEDGYGVRLGDTELYSFFEELQVLPPDTVICLMRPYIWGATSNQEKYAEAETYFKNLITFGN